MKTIKLFIATSVCALFLSGCIFGNSYVDVTFREVRTGLIGMNVIGIIGSPEANVEIVYSTAVEGTGGNETISRRISLPYLFRDNRVYMTYEYFERTNSGASRPFEFGRYLIRSFEKGSAEYFTLINHSPEYEIEFFITSAQSIRGINNRNFPPNITYKDTPLYYLLFPERNPLGNNIEPWTEEEIAVLYREEFARSELVQLWVAAGSPRMIDLVEGRGPGTDRFRGAIFYGIIEPEGRLQANDRAWLLATPTIMFDNIFDIGLF